MPIPHAVTRFNKRFLNRIIKPIAGRVPPFAILGHTGRTSGKAYELPIMAFPAGDRFAIALTYGPETDWVKNVQASGTGTLTYRGERYSLSNPTILIGEPGLRLIGQPFRAILRVLRVDHVMALDRESERTRAVDSSGASSRSS